MTLRHGFQFGQRILWQLLYALSRVVPREPRLWAFGSWHGTRFADNAKWLFVHTALRPGKVVRPVWISKSAAVVAAVRAEGFEAHHATSLKGLWLSLRAGVYLYDAAVDDVSYWASNGALLVNLWHGIALKQIERDIEQRGHSRWKAYHGGVAERLVARFKAPWTCLAPDVVIGTSEETAAVFARAFGVDAAEVPVTGYPRNDVLLGDCRHAVGCDQRLIARVQAARDDGLRVLCYMPTFRDTSGSGRALPLEWAELDRYLRDRGAVMLLKLHSHDSAALPDLSAMPSLIPVASGEDVYPLLRLTDVLVSDYSSVYFDFLLLDRPILFYAYDLERYSTADRGLYYDYREVTPGPLARDFAELLAALGAALAAVRGEAADPWAGERRRCRERFHAFCDASSADRVYREVARRAGVAT
jgi:CDP-glycerol glycerophosphotransferase (TagB/SpsB family)